jgi:hypothetical protein
LISARAVTEDPRGVCGQSGEGQKGGEPACEKAQNIEARSGCFFSF